MNQEEYYTQMRQLETEIAILALKVNRRANAFADPQLADYTDKLLQLHGRLNHLLNEFRDWIENEK